MYDDVDISKASHILDISTKIFKKNVDLFPPFLLNMSINLTTFPSVLKLADVTPLQSNYWPISVLPNQSTIFENILYSQIVPYFEEIFSKYQTGFRKGFNSQDCLIAMIKNFRNSLHKGGKYVALLTDLPKAFDCLPDDLKISKLQV